MAIRIPTATAGHSDQPVKTTRFATTKPAIPKSAVCASETMPP